MITGECTLPDTTHIQNSTLQQSANLNSEYTFVDVINRINDLVTDLINNTFGVLTTTNTISQNQIDQTTENGWITGMYTPTAMKGPRKHTNGN